MAEIDIRPARPEDDDAIWAIMEPVIREGRTYTLDRDLDRTGALAYWYRPGNAPYVAEVDGQIVGTYYLRPNRDGGGSHVANCGYMTAPWARRRGVARAMCHHSLDLARSRGFRAMQFNFVVSANQRAVRLWQHCGFDVIGRIPEGFNHPDHGFVDALVMYRAL